MCRIFTFGYLGTGGVENCLKPVHKSLGLSLLFRCKPRALNVKPEPRAQKIPAGAGWAFFKARPSALLVNEGVSTVQRSGRIAAHVGDAVLEMPVRM